MTHAPEHPPDQEPRGEEHPHGLVEELKEELGHAVETAVEHVPKPVRWTVRKLVLLAAVALVTLVVLAVVSIVLYYANRTQLVAQELTVFLNGTLATRSDVSIEIRDIKGNPFREVRLIDPRVRFRDGEDAPLLEAPSIRLRYSAWGLVRSSRRSVEIDVDQPVIRLSRGPDGKLRLPAWKSSGPSTPAENRAFDVRLRLHHGKLLAPAPLGATEGIELDASVAADRTTQVRIEDLRWSRGMFQTREARLLGEISKGDSVVFAVRRFRSADLDLRARGAWKSGSDHRDLHVRIDRVRWRWVAEAAKQDFFDVAGEGNVTLDAVEDHGFSGRFATEMNWDQNPVTANGNFTFADQHLVVKPLVLHAPAGDLSGAAQWTRSAWEIGGDVQQGDPSHWSVIGLEGWPEGKLSGRFLYHVDTRKPDHVAGLEAVLGTSVIADWNVDHGEVAVQFPVGPDSFQVHMARRGGEAWLRGLVDKDGWHGAYQIAQFPLDEWPQGRSTNIHGTVTRGEGTVMGHSGTLTVTGTLDGVATDWLGMHAGKFRLDRVEGQLLPTSNLTMGARLGDMTWLGVHFDSTLASVHLIDQSLALEDVRAHAGDTLFTAAGNSRWDDAGWSVALDRARARSHQFDWTADPPVRIAGDKTGVLFDRLAAHDGTATLAIDGRWAVPGGVYEWRASVRSLDLARVGMPEAWGLGGASDAELVVQGSYEEPRWSLDSRTSHPAFGGHRADSLRLALDGAHHRLEVREGELRLESSVVRARGAFDQTARAEPESLTATAVTRWLTSAQRWSGTAGVQFLPLERIAGMVPAAKGWSGNLSGTLAVDGSPANPRLEATASAAPLSWQGYRVDDFRARASYRDELLSVSELRMTRGHLVSTASGEMPLHLALGQIPEMPERPMSWKLEVPNGDLAVIPLFVPQIGFASGKLEVHAVVKGTPKHPDLDGQLKIRDGRVRLSGREELLEGLYADCRLDESRITLDSLTARQGKTGRLSARGAVEVSGAGLKGYRFDLAMRGFSALESGVYAAEFDGDFAVVDGPRVNQQIIPKVTGNVTLKKAVVLFDFASQSAVQQMTAQAQPIFWTYDINLTATNGLRWQPPDGDIEFSANLRLEQTLDQLIIFGDMTSLRGTYYFLSNRFTVDKANLTFDNAEGGVNPTLDISAETNLTANPEATILGGGSYSQGVPQNKNYTIIVAITGRAREPVIVMSSDPSDLDEARILQQLTVGRFVSGTGAVSVKSVSDPLDNYVTRAINKTLSAEMSRTFRGYVNEWTLDRETGGLWTGTGDVYLGVGSQVTPNLLVRYKQRVPGFAREGSTSLTTNPFERDVEAEYRLNRFFYVSSQLTQRRTITGGTTPTSGPDFNLNLKARWEY